MNSDLARTFFDAWENGVTEYTVFSSGSTGAPKPFVLQKKWMEWSAIHTANAIQVKDESTLMCCLPINKVGGLMMLVRSKIWESEIIVLEASANPLLEYCDADITSFTPYQLYSILENEKSRKHLNRFHTILIGGGEISKTLEQQLQNLDSKTIFFQTYGMTETYSHIALRRLNGNAPETHFKTFENVHVEKDIDGCARITAPFSDKPLQTNDIIELLEDGRFRILGRKDFMINSGGVKLMPETIENMLDEVLQPKSRFLISGQKDEKLGERLVLVCENSTAFANVDLGFLSVINPYAIPKAILEIESIPLNAGGKPDRMRIKEMINM